MSFRICLGSFRVSLADFESLGDGKKRVLCESILIKHQVFAFFHAEQPKSAFLES